MSNEILYILLPDFASHEMVYLMEAVSSDEMQLKSNPKYINKVVVYMDKVEIYFKLNIIEQQELSVVSLPMTAEEDIDTIKREYKSLLKQ